MPTLLIGIWRVSACPCTSSTGFTVGFLTGTATFISGFPAGAIRHTMVPKPRIPRILDDSERLGAKRGGPGHPTGGANGGAQADLRPSDAQMEEIPRRAPCGAVSKLDERP